MTQWTMGDNIYHMLHDRPGVGDHGTKLDQMDQGWQSVVMWTRGDKMWSSCVIQTTGVTNMTMWTRSDHTDPGYGPVRW